MEGVSSGGFFDMFTNFTADSEGIDTDKIVAKFLAAVTEPNDKDY